MSQKTNQIPLDQLDALADKLPAINTVDVTIEVLDEAIGDQLEAIRLPWHGIVYDRRSEIIELSVGGRDRRIPVVLRHLIHRPTGVWLEEEDGRTKALLVEAAASPRTIVTFHERAALGAGDHASKADISE